MSVVFKLLRLDEFQAFNSTSEYYGSADDIRDGFVHLSTARQLPGTLARHFAGDNELVLLAFDDVDLGGALKWEPSRDGALFPHVYGALPVEKAMAEHRLTRRPNGVMELPEL